MIDEKKFMEFMSELEEAGAEHVRFDDLRKFVDEFPKICVWIPCSERLPEDGQKVLVSKSGKTLEEIFEFQLPDEEDRECYEEEFGCDALIGYFTPKNGISIGIYSNDTVTIAWQPLPEVYHG